MHALVFFVSFFSKGVIGSLGATLYFLSQPLVSVLFRASLSGPATGGNGPGGPSTPAEQLLLLHLLSLISSPSIFSQDRGAGLQR